MLTVSIGQHVPGSASITLPNPDTRVSNLGKGLYGRGAIVRVITPTKVIERTLKARMD
jgi:hypothetical protein